MTRCENCGYVNQDSAQRCIKCNAPLMSNETQKVPPPPPPDDSRNTIPVIPKQPGSAGGFVLVALSEDGTKEGRIIDLDLKGSEIILNREILDKDNLSLSRGGQAKLIQQVDTWRIENMSSLGSTYLRISSPTEIKEGDVILLGDTLFLFKKKS